MAVLQVAAGVWCSVEFRRSGRHRAELWGVDWLDIVYASSERRGEAHRGRFRLVARGRASRANGWPALGAG